MNCLSQFLDVPVPTLVTTSDRCYIACWFRNGAVLKFDQFHNSSFF